MTVPGNALSPACVATGLTNGRVGAAVKVVPSVVSFAVRVSVSGVKSVTVKAAAPLLIPEMARGGTMVSWLPALAVRGPVFPLTSLPLLSYRLTLTKLGEAPSAGSPEGAGAPAAWNPLCRNANTADTDGSTAPTVWLASF